MILAGLCMAGHEQTSSVRGWRVDIRQLHGVEFLEDLPGGEPGGMGFYQTLQGDVKAVDDEGKQDVCLNPVFLLAMDRTDRETVLEFPEGLFFPRRKMNTPLFLPSPDQPAPPPDAMPVRPLSAQRPACVAVGPGCCSDAATHAGVWDACCAPWESSLRCVPGCSPPHPGAANPGPTAMAARERTAPACSGDLSAYCYLSQEAFALDHILTGIPFLFFKRYYHFTVSSNAALQ